ncbi:MAG TPA: hypothetical protein VKS60_16405 [Stellaceae bacterium]|nr:hypothetical protein [Stellaceae bacterium]
MAIESFKKEWIFIKKNYEKATGKKKPSAALSGATDKAASGLEPACAALDSAIGKGDYGAAERAREKIESLGKVYQKALAEATRGEDKAITAELKVMMGEIDIIIAEAAAQTEQLWKLHDMAADLKNIAETWAFIAKDCADTPIGNNPHLRAFISDPVFGQNFARPGEVDPAMQKLQQQAKAALISYVKKLGEIKAAKINVDSDKAMTDFMKQVDDASCYIGSAPDGVRGIVATWQVEVDADRATTIAFNASPQLAVITALTAALKQEEDRLYEVKNDFELRVMNRAAAKKAA